MIYSPNKKECLSKEKKNYGGQFLANPTQKKENEKNKWPESIQVSISNLQPRSGSWDNSIKKQIKKIKA